MKSLKNLDSYKLQYNLKSENILPSTIRLAHLNLFAKLNYEDISDSSPTDTLRTSKDLLPSARTDRTELHKYRGNKKLEKIKYSPATEDYYDRLPIQPGFLFLDSLMNAPGANINELQINLPESYYNTQDAYFLYTDQAGFVNCSQQVNIYEFYKTIGTVAKQNREVDSDSGTDTAVVVIRSKVSTNINNTFILNWEQFRSRVENHETFRSTVVQKYIKSPGDRPSITRMFYFAHTKDNKANYAYLITNKTYGNSKKKSVANLFVNTTQGQYLDITKTSGTALKPFERETVKVIEFLQKGYRIRFENICLDFIKDEKGKIWLISCKGFRVDHTTYLNISSPNVSGSRRNTSRSLSRRELYSSAELKKFDRHKSALCKLCRLYYPHEELSHSTSVRMLLRFKQQIGRRREISWNTSHIKIPNPEMLSQTVRICRICYMLITSEMDLMETGIKFAQKLSIPYIDKDREADKRFEVQLQFLPKRLLQWRILLILKSLQFHYQADMKHKLTLMINFYGLKTSFELESLEHKTDGRGVTIYIPFMKLHFVYSHQDKSIARFLEDTEFELRIVENGDWDCMLLKGEAKLLSDFPSDLSRNTALTTFKQITFFDLTFNPVAHMSLTVGFSCDSTILTKNIKVFLDKFNEVFIPEEFYFRTDPLPLEWMEVLSHSKLDETFGPDIPESDFYQPRLEPMDLWRMEDNFHPFSHAIKKKVKNIQAIPSALKERMQYRHDEIRKSFERRSISNFRSSIRKRDAVKSSIPRSRSYLKNYEESIDETVVSQLRSNESRIAYSTVCEYLKKKPINSRTFNLAKISVGL
jgi:hypothetical protein